MKSFRTFQIRSILLIFILLTIGNAQTTTNSCGSEYEYSIFDDKLTVEVNGEIIKNDWGYYKEILFNNSHHYK